jgi:cytochrome P450
MTTKDNCTPVSVARASGGASLLGLLGMARKNLLSVWSDNGYRSQTLSFKFLRQHYFVCNTPESVRRVFLEEHDNYDRKSPQMRHALEPLLGDGLFVSDGDLWKQRREYCAPAFENDLLPDFAGIMIESAAEVAESWKALPSGSSVDMLNEMARLTARIIGRTIFGDNTLDTEAAQVVQGFTGYQRHVEQLDMADSLGLPFLRWFRNPLRHARTMYSAKKVHEIIDRIIERDKDQGENARFTLISLLLDGKTGKPGASNVCPLTTTAARNEAIVMFMAGHETTANSLAWTWYLLDHCSDAMEKLHEELDRVLAGRIPTLEDVDKLHYTRAVFEESMRLYPPVPLLSRQARKADEIHGRKIEAGSIILVLPWLLHRHEDYWDEPNAFRPERFLPDQPKPDKFCYLPFSVGRRVCLGKRFGLTEGILCLATLAQHFRPRLVPGHEVDIECRLTLRPKGGLPMILEPRNP